MRITRKIGPIPRLVLAGVVAAGAVLFLTAAMRGDRAGPGGMDVRAFDYLDVNNFWMKIWNQQMIGDNTSVEDNCVIHARPDDQTSIGNWVTVGHGAIVHNATVRDWALLGMGCIVSDWAVVGEWAVVAEGAVVKQNLHIPDNRIAVGTPARILEKQVADDFKAQWREFKKVYVDLARRYPMGLGKGVTDLLQRSVHSGD